MSASGTFIAGGGLAGAKTAEALREQGFDSRIALAAEEDIRPYERPPLSKDYLPGMGSSCCSVRPSPQSTGAAGRTLAAGRPVTLLTATRDLNLSQAVVLAGLLREKERS